MDAPAVPRAPGPMAWMSEAVLLQPHGTALQGLRLLAFLRVFAPIAQVLTLFVVTRQYGVVVPVQAILVVLAVEVAVAVATWVRVHRAPEVSELELVLQAHLDIAMLAVLLYFTGGASNPFAPLFLLPMVIAASAQKARGVWITMASTMLAYVVLRYEHVGLFHPEGLTEVYSLQEDGMVVNYLFTAALLAYFVSRMHAAFGRHERALAEAHDAQMRLESVVAIGALAAGYAHELSTPLGTMLVVVTELKREHGGNPALHQDLQIIDDQLRASKQIVSNMANAADRRRAETASAARTDQFIEAIVERARALHPGANITAQLDRATPAPLIVAEETLRQAVTNLIDNAVDVSPQYVAISADWSSEYLLIAVCDRGPGFDPRMLGRLGKQAGTTKGPGGGMGLGLLLSATSLERLGGALELMNEASGGARAQIRLPLRSIRVEHTNKPRDGSSP